jgi:tubulin-specific chaperone D
METVKKVIKTSGSPHLIFEVLYTLTKIRGYKTILKFFPHEASDLEPCFYYLEGIKDPTLWQSQYILLIWLSMIVLVPFDLDTIDSSGNLINQILSRTKTFLEHTGKPREGAALTIAKLLTRPDIMQRGLLHQFLDWSISIINSQQDFLELGSLYAVVQIFTYGTRSELLNHIKTASKFLEKSTSENTYLKQLKVKLAGRLALTQLRPIVASWRYSRGSRSLSANLLSVNITGKIITNSAHTFVKAFSSEFDAEQSCMDRDIDMEILETEIDALLTGLRNRDNVVRWSAAKAIGRITGRLDKDMGDEIVAQVLELFRPEESDSAWHGGCLALAELARRGLLLPERLTEVFPLMYQALLYDKKHGNHSIGAHVRDAACYLAWSFARAYAPEEMQGHLNELGRYLIIVALFDREVNCRRAASAAFQEHVGRQGSFPHGIEILTEADYFTLGNRNHAYLHVSCFIAQFNEYLCFMIDHLLDQKLKHWDIVIRQLAGCALSVLVPFAPDYYIQTVLPNLLASVYHNNLVIRHGCILGTAESLLGLAGKSGENNDPKTIEKIIYKHSGNYYLLKPSKDDDKDQALIKDSDNRRYFKDIYRKLQLKNNLNLISNEILTSIKEVVPNIEKKRLYRGKGGQIIRIGVCRYLECLSKSKIGLTQGQILKIQETLNECISHNAPEVQEAGCSAFREFSKVYHNSIGLHLVRLTYNYHISILNSFNQLKEVPANTSRGAALALGCFSYSLLLYQPTELIDVLIQTTKIKNSEQDDVETRRNAALSLGQIAITVLEKPLDHNPDDVVFEQLLPLQEFDLNSIEKILETLISCSEDYTNDKRGDVGSFVRAATMQSLLEITQTAYVISNNMWERIISVLLRQIVEKIDRLRQVAGDTIEKILQNNQLPDWSEYLRPVFIDNKEFLQKFQEKHEKSQGAEALPDQSEMPIQSSVSYYERSNLWSVPNFVFPLVCPLLNFPVFRKEIIRGIVISVGGITESTVRSSSEELVKAVMANTDIVYDILNLFKNCEERLEIPFMKVFALLLKNIDVIHTLGIGAPVLARSQDVIKGSKDIFKWLAFVDVVSGLLDNPDCRREALRIVLVALGQPFPKVRTLAAQNLFNYFNSVLSYSQICESEQDFNSILDLIAGTAWGQGLNEVRPARNQIFSILGMEPPKLKTQVQEVKEVKDKQDDSYKSLVQEVGF